MMHYCTFCKKLHDPELEEVRNEAIDEIREVVLKPCKHGRLALRGCDLCSYDASLAASYRETK